MNDNVIELRPSEGLIRINGGIEKDTAKPVFFVDAFYDGAWLCLCAVYDYSEAILYAEEIAAEESARVIDEVA